MKYIFSVIILSLLVWAKTVDCVVPQPIVKEVKPLFTHPIVYSQLQVNIKTSIDDIAALQQLQHQKKTKFAIIRRDILWQITQSKSDIKQHYILISELPFEAMLYLVQNQDMFDTDIDTFIHKNISIGTLGEFNNIYLKKYLKKSHMIYHIMYKSLTYQESITAIMDGKLDAYFGFLLLSNESTNLHFQTLFSKTLVSYFQAMHIFNIDYNGIASPYVLVASREANDEEIENIIYRLMKKKSFKPITDKRFGTVNRYVLNHLEQVQKALKHTYTKNKHTTVDARSNICRQYHYGFLKLLRQKPAWEKRVKRLLSPQKRVKLIQAFNTILLEIDAQKDKCNLNFLKHKRKNLINLKGKIKYNI